MEREIHGFYYDGEKSWTLYIDNDGKMVMKEDEKEDDEQTDQNGSKEEIRG